MKGFVAARSSTSLFLGVCLTSGSSGFDVRIEVASPVNHGTYEEGHYPIPLVNLEFGSGPVSEAIRDSPADFELCVDYEAAEPGRPGQGATDVYKLGCQFKSQPMAKKEEPCSPPPAHPTLVCRGLFEGGDLVPPVAVRPADGAHWFKAWLRPQPTEANLRAYQGDSFSRGWGDAGDWWAGQGCASEPVAYFTGPGELSLRVLSPVAGASYGGSVVAAELEFTGPADYELCLAWDASPAPASSSPHSSSFPPRSISALDASKSPWSGGGAASPVAVVEGRRDRADKLVECRPIGSTDFRDSPSPETSPETSPEGLLGGQGEGPTQKLFRAWLARPGGGGAVLAVDVPYSTFRTRPGPEGGTEEGGGPEGAEVGARGGTRTAGRSRAWRTAAPLPEQPRPMSDARVLALWERLGLHLGQDPGQAAAGSEGGADSASGSAGGPAGHGARGARGKRFKAMAASRDPEALIESLEEELSRAERDLLLAHLRGPNDFPRTLAACDFARWARKYNFTRPRAALLTAERDLEVAFLDLRGAGAASYTYLPTPSGCGGAGSRDECGAGAAGDGGSAGRPQSVPTQSVTVLAYDPDTGAGDLHHLLEGGGQGGGLGPLPGEPFDVALVSQTLEHLYDPARALRGLLGRLAPGGFFFTSVPALSIPHMAPFHFASFTPMGLAVLLEAAGFEVLELGQWGNADYASKLLRSKSWPSFGELDRPIENDPGVPCALWALARRPPL